METKVVVTSVIEVPKDKKLRQDVWVTINRSCTQIKKKTLR